MASATGLPVSPSASRRELARRVRDAFPPMGVYAIHNLATGRVRVLSSRNVPGAINRATFELKMRNSRDRELQSAWDRLGEQAVRFEVLEMVRERPDPAFDHDAELAALLELWRDERETQGGPQ